MIYYILFILWWGVGSVSFYLLDRHQYKMKLDVHFFYVCLAAGMFGPISLVVYLLVLYKDKRDANF